MTPIWQIVTIVSLLVGGRNEHPAVLGHVLFIGNSLTEVNDLPGMVQALAESTGVASRPVESVTGPGYSLLDQLPARLRSRGGVLVEIAPATARLLQEAAHETNALFRGRLR